MAKKKAAVPDPRAEPTPRKLVRLELEEDVHDALRVIAARGRLSMALYVRKLVTEHVRALQ